MTQGASELSERRWCVGQLAGCLASLPHSPAEDPTRPPPPRSLPPDPDPTQPRRSLSVLTAAQTGCKGSGPVLTAARVFGCFWRSGGGPPVARAWRRGPGQCAVRLQEFSHLSVAVSRRLSHMYLASYILVLIAYTFTSKTVSRSSCLSGLISHIFGILPPTLCIIL